ncbi:MULTISPECIES: restriction endonuclease [Flavobacterium]|uniref:Restriction endonuclease type IV Mrr domain-containing protein n=1 Tax=Flavobacterium hankyongi TaxID=1176532 RepID=A0ABP8ZQ39_9FLAO|nr:restriction endonuclease [Flavobacterium sp. N1846]
MNNYDFSTLNDKEFEQISKDLLNAKFDLQLQSFKSGKDKGVDLRFSTKQNNNSIVVQAKHYSKSKYSDLKSIIKNKELNNVKNLNPDRYILVTSLNLSAIQKDELKIILDPYIKTSNDIIGQEELNEYLSEFSHIEKKYYKLWLSSTNIISEILNNAVESRTKYFLNRLTDKIKYYVVTEKLDLANNILKEEKILLITGQPGIGKTSLAEMILFERAKNNFKIHKVENIKEAEDVISNEDKIKQIFYFDDFLGANYAEIINSHKTETQLTSFVDRIRHSPNKYLLLTTRTIVLNLANDRYEKINQSSLNDRKFELKLSDYDKYEKALILYNHFFHKSVTKKFYNVIIDEKFYLKIINHDNYTPRIIEFITDDSKIKLFSDSEYKQFIINNLNNPKEIWRFSYNNQITYLERCLLMTLFSFGNFVSENKLIRAFEKRLQYEIKQHNQVVDGNQFNKSIKLLLNGFISSTLYNSIDKNKRSYNFINPSLADFLIGQTSESLSEKKGIINNAIFLEQLDRFNPKTSIIHLDQELQLIIRDLIKNDHFLIDKKEYEDKNQIIFFNCKIITILSDYCSEVNIDNIYLHYLKKIDFKIEWNYTIFSTILNSLLKIKDCPQTEEYVNKNFLKIIRKIIAIADSEFEADEIKDLFDKYNQDYNEFSKTEEGVELIENMIINIIQTSENELTDQIKDEVTEISKVEEIYEEIFSTQEKLIKELFPTSNHNLFFEVKLDKSEWENIIEENQIKENMREYDEWEDNNYKKENYDSTNLSDEDKINDLFN